MTSTIEITLDGKAVELKPSLKAATTISRQANGLVGAIEALGKLDMDVLTHVIALGADRDDVKALEEPVWRAGISDLATRAIEYVTLLANGGRTLEGGAKP